MNDREQLLTRINKDVPPGVDWKSGAERYVAALFEKMGRANVERFSMNKPFGMTSPGDPGPAIVESVHYLNNFANALDLLRPQHGSRVLDVACGGGWVSHLLSKMGYWTYGIDISADFIELASERLSLDPYLHLSIDEASRRFSVIDIETTPLPPELRGTFDYVWLESCLHHFVDPIAALEHLADALKPDGVLVLIEFENRKGVIRNEYLEVMREYDTLERPYSRSELEGALNLAGFNHYEFFGTVNGWYSPHDAAALRLTDMLVQGAADMNLALCTKQRGRLNALFPHLKSESRFTFGRGFSESHNGFRWSGPSSELIVNGKIDTLQIEVHSTIPAEQNRDQIISVHGAAGERGRLTLTPQMASGTLNFDKLEKGERLLFHSADAFSPSWNGSSDERLLSFYIKNIE